MSTHIALLLFGGGLLLIAVFDGPFGIPSTPQAERRPRILAAISGLFFVILSVSVGTAASPGEKEGVARSAVHERTRSQGSSGVRFVIFDELEPHRIASDYREQAVIRIDGVPVGTLILNEYFPKSELIVDLANEGQHGFTIEATAIFRINNTLAEVSCFGTGTIHVATESRFRLKSVYDPRGRSCLTRLEKH
jgi:hypothetical protein